MTFAIQCFVNRSSPVFLAFGIFVLTLTGIASADPDYAEINRLSAHLQTHPKDADALASRAGHLAAAGAYDLAFKDCLKATQLAPRNADYWAAKATVLLSQRKYKEADRSCRIALGHDGHNSVALQTKARIELEQGRNHQALATASTGLLVDSSNAHLWRIRSHANARIGNRHAAIADLRAAIANDSSDARTWNDLGHFLRLANRLPEALVAFNEAFKLDNDSEEVNYNLGRVHLALGNADSAKNALDRVLQPLASWKTPLNEAYAEIALLHGEAAARAGNWSAAIAHFKSSDSRRSTGQVRGQLRHAYIQELHHLLTNSGKSDEAEALFHVAVQEFPGDVQLISTHFAASWTAWADAQAKVTVNDFEAARDRLRKAWEYGRSSSARKRHVAAIVRLMEVYASMPNRKSDAGLAYADALRYASGDRVLTDWVISKWKALNL